jgi:hypothetical protein
MPPTTGSTAWEILHRSTRATVWGRTSRGLFLAPESDGMLFLTTHPWRGPLTINLPALPNWPQGAAIHLSPTALRRPPFEEVSLAEPVIWQPSPPQDRRRQSSCQRMSQQAAQRMSQQAAQRIERMLTHAPSSSPSDSGKSVLSVDSPASPSSDSVKSVPSVDSCLSPDRLGLGPGLTPLGDDLLTGALLLLARYPDLRPDISLPAFAAPILAAAGQRTTRLSAAILACAAQGLADERLILALDALVTASASDEQIAAWLASYGSTSGWGVLQGWQAVITSP